MKLLAFLLLAAAGHATTTPTFDLWPRSVASPSGLAETDTTRPGDDLIAGEPVIRLGHVTVPSVTLFPASPGLATGAAVIVCPGGGYNILAWDLEGIEVCHWLNSIGLTGVLLKYRVPGPDDGTRYLPALQDVQRAISLIRHRAQDFSLDPDRIGVLGFSAGAHLSATLVARDGRRDYPALDAADQVSSRPNFVVLIYPAMVISDQSPTVLLPEVTPAKGRAVPAFISMAQNDPFGVENALAYYRAVVAAGAPAELHLYPSGGHGYGLRRTQDNVTTWPARAAAWLQQVAARPEPDGRPSPP